MKKNKNILILAAFFLFTAKGLPATESAPEQPFMLEIEKNGGVAEEVKEATDSVSFQEDEMSIFDWSLTNFYNSQTTPFEDSDCNGIEDVNVDVTDEEYIKRLSMLPNLIELPYNSIVKSYIDLYLVRHRDQVKKLVALGKYYFPIFEQALEEQQMPLELKYLPVIESALNPNAFSKAGASGLWQFMIGTGKIYGLQVDNLIDERRDPIKSTQAGVKYLNDLYKIYNDWHLAIAAYNCGPGNVNKAIRRAGGKKDYWAIYYFLPKETRGYVPAFIAANYVMNYYSQHNICPVEIADLPTLTDTIIVNQRLHLQQVSEMLNISIEELRYINPQYRRDIIPGNICGYALCLPQNQAGSFLERRDTIFLHRADELINNLRTEVKPTQSSAASSSGNKIYYVVRSGDNLGKLAARYKVSINSIKNWNNLRSNSIRIGQRLVIYRNGAQPASSSSTSAKATSGTYVVKSGDTLWKISQHNGVTINELAKANNISSNTRLRIGQVLKIPKK